MPVSLWGQVSAGFTASDTIGCNPLKVDFINTGSTGAEYSYEWFFESGKTDTLEDPSYEFFNGGSYEVIQVITNTNSSETDTARQSITVIRTPSAKLRDIDSTNACVGGIVTFETFFASKTSAIWDFGDGTTLDNTAAFVSHVYSGHGVYNINYITFYESCSDTSESQLTIDGPIADFDIVPEAACKGAPITFILGDTTDVQSFSWNVGENDVVLTGDSAVHEYETMGLISPGLTVNGVSGTCTIQDTIEIFQIAASFSYADDQLCNQETIVFFNTSDGKDFNYWDLGNGEVSSAINPSTSYDAGNYIVKLKIQNSEGCFDSTETTITINNHPELQITPAPEVCPGESTMLNATGGHVILWSPPQDFDDPASYTPTVSPDSSSSYTVLITDTITHCSSSGESIVQVQEGFIVGKITVVPEDTSIYTGDTVFVSFTDSLNRQLSYSWSPDEQISCIDCAEPSMIPLQSTTYMLEVSDGNQCAIYEVFEVATEVTEAYRFGVADAFTPNGDGINDVIKVDGVGVRQLLEFRIFSRSGTQVFYTDDISESWDGTYNDNPQAIDSYAYVIRAEMWNGKVIEEKGTFSLLR